MFDLADPPRQDVNFYVAHLDASANLELSIDDGRQAYLLCMEGAISGNVGDLEQHDAAQLGSGSYKIKATDKGGHVLVVEMAKA